MLEVHFNNSLASYLTHILVDTRNRKFQVKYTLPRLLHLNTQKIQILPLEIIDFVYMCLEI